MPGRRTEPALEQVERQVDAVAHAGGREIGPSSTTLLTTTSTPGNSFRNAPRASLWVVARWPSRMPARPSRKAPVHTEATVGVFLARSRMNGSSSVVLDRRPVVRAGPAGHDQGVERRAVGDRVGRQTRRPPRQTTSVLGPTVTTST